MNIEENKYKNSNPFTTPEGYFENLHKRVMEHVLQQQQPKQKNIALWRKQFIGYAAAAMITIATGLSVYNISTDTNEQQGTTAYESEEQMLEDFIDNYPIDEYILYSYLTSTDTGF